MKVIALSGIDGSGKTTQANLLEKYLTEKGKRVVRFHAVSFSIANRVLKKEVSQVTPTTEKEPEVLEEQKRTQQSVAEAGFGKIFLRKIALLIDLCRFKKYYRNLEASGVDFLIADRYFYDQIINILYLSKKEKISGLLKIAERKITQPDLYFWINVTPEIAMQRERQIDQGIDYLKIKQGLYQKFSTRWNMKEIDANQPKEEIFQIIKESVN